MGRNPSIKTVQSDQEKLDTLRFSVMEKSGLQGNLVQEDFSRQVQRIATTTQGENISSYCFSELSPVCAVVGGVLSQEIIKVCYDD